MKITLITAVYNAEDTVGEAVASVACQTFSCVEHIIIEGCSTDGSVEAIERSRHDRMRLISEPDDGIYDALNKGIEHATGDIIGFIHSDDFLAHKDVLSRVASLFQDSEVEAVYSDLDYVSKLDSSQVVRHWSTGLFRPHRLKFGWMPAHPTLFFRREVYDRVGGFDTSFEIAADYDLVLRYFSELNPKTAYLPEVTYKMRLGGISNRSIGRILQKMHEDYRAIRRNRVGGVFTLVAKNLSKIGQFLVNPPKGPT